MCGAADNVAALVASCRNCLRASLMAMLHELSTSQTHPIIFNNGLNVCCLPGGPKTSCAGTHAECLLLAQSGHHAAEFQCLLLGVKRTSEECAAMSAFDPKRKWNASFCCDAQSRRSPSTN